MRMLAILFLAALLAASMNSTAHAVAYVGVADGIVICQGKDVPGIGGVCYPPGHVTCDPLNGCDTISASDALSFSVGGMVCQPAVQPQGAYVRGDCIVSIDFCGSTVLDPIFGPTYDPTLPVLVFMDGLVFGNPATSSCGFATTGTVTHG